MRRGRASALLLTAPQPCQAVQTLSSLYDTAEYQEAHVVAVDEARGEASSSPAAKAPCSRSRLSPALPQAQFFTDLREFCVTAVDKHRKTLLVAGLDGDFRRQPFGQARAAGQARAERKLPV